MLAFCHNRAKAKKKNLLVWVIISVYKGLQYRCEFEFRLEVTCLCSEFHPLQVKPSINT